MWKEAKIDCYQIKEDYVVHYSGYCSIKSIVIVAFIDIIIKCGP
jgi:hypothetical protein